MLGEARPVWQGCPVVRLVPGEDGCRCRILLRPWSVLVHQGQGSVGREARGQGRGCFEAVAAQHRSPAGEVVRWAVAGLWTRLQRAQQWVVPFLAPA